MRENEFEKKVREKMERLGLEPSEAVWVGVDKEINKEKRRRVPLFWLFFVSGLLLAGGAYYFVTNKNNAEVLPNKNTENRIAKIPEQQSSSKKQIEQPILQSAEAQRNNNKKKNGETESFDSRHHVAGGSTINQEPVGRAAVLNQDKKPARAGLSVKSKEKSIAAIASTTVGTEEIVVHNYDGKSEKAEAEKVNKTIPDSTTGKMNSTTTQNKSNKDSVTGATIAHTKEQKKKSSSWKIGYTAGIGSSNLNQNLFNSVKTLAPVVNTTVAAAPLSNGGMNYSSSEINPGFSFQAGAFISRNLSKRFSFSAGVNYHYYSTTMRTGIKINTTLVTTNSIGQTITANSYYENTRTQTFTNQYHLIEIPLSVSFQLNKSRRMPFIWELGLTPGYIVSSNALYYDPNTNVYFNNYLQPDKMQLNGVTALMIGLPFYKGQLQLGPQIQYGFTGFVNTKDGNPGHLFYAGLKISFVPGKK